MSLRPFVLPLALLAAAVAAQSPAAPASVAVSYADLDLSRPAGVAVLDRRLARAADAVCGVPDARDLRAAIATRACRTAALTAANAELKPVLAARQTAAYAQAGALAGGR